eukprot:6213678-Pleurochrysis_carterae.AAC.9
MSHCLRFLMPVLLAQQRVATPASALLRAAGHIALSSLSLCVYSSTFDDPARVHSPPLALLTRLFLNFVAAFLKVVLLSYSSCLLVSAFLASPTFLTTASITLFQYPDDLFLTRISTLASPLPRARHLSARLLCPRNPCLPPCTFLRSLLLHLILTLTRQHFGYTSFPFLSLGSPLTRPQPCRSLVLLVTLTTNSLPFQMA